MITADFVEKGEYSSWPTTLAVGFHGLPIAFDRDSFKENKITGWNRDHNLTLMQFTGLKDKNGKEIYEGDVVLVPNAFYDPSEGESPNEIKKVDYHAGEFGMDRGKGGDWESLKDYWDGKEGAEDLEIIGNIYENPDLLKP